MHRTFKGLGIVLFASIILVGCGQKNTTEENQKGDNELENHNNVQETEIDEIQEKVEKVETEIIAEENDSDTNQKATVAFETDLDKYDSSMFEKANAWSNGFMFDCTWRGDNITFEDGIMKLTINSDGETSSPKWSGSEYRTKKFYSYGLYEVRMKPIKNDGVVSSFFTYTGPSDSNPWDEIDIEFLGKDTNIVQLNYFTNGIGNHEYIHELGFDAFEEFHTYAFEWLPDSITWYVDGESIYTATADIPSTPGKLMMNVWPGTGVDSWLKAFDGTVPLTAEYDWFRVTQYEVQ
ncbi:MAG TPA: glycoside hydrolase family 16 protein [Mobilitalea sp.]|nr:glycoside hydrolase family 16 protein [Mobilitalea sp.]